MKKKPQEPELTLKGAAMIDDFETMLICAVRYAIGRRTYMPGLITEFIMNDVGKQLHERAVLVMLEDLRRTPASERGDPCDVRTWERFEQWLKEKKEEFNRGDQC